MRDDDVRWMGAAVALGARGQGQTWPNPNVGCILVRDGRVVGRGWTQPGGRPHAEAMAVAQAGDAASGATAFVTLEPCALPGRGPACSDILIKAGVARVVAAVRDPFPAVDGKGFARLKAAGIAVTVGPGAADAARSMAGFLVRQRSGRPHVTLKLALALDGVAAMSDGRSQWITGAEARAHVHIERVCADVILVGRGTYEADKPTLDVRLPGLEGQSPRRAILSASMDTPPEGWTILRSVAEIAHVEANRVLVEGGVVTAAALLAADLVDRMLIYRAPILIGGGRTLGDIGLSHLGDAHGRWACVDTRCLGSDMLDVYERVRG